MPVERIVSAFSTEVCYSRLEETDKFSGCFRKWMIQ